MEFAVADMRHDVSYGKRIFLSPADVPGTDTLKIKFDNHDDPAGGTLTLIVLENDGRALAVAGAL